MSEKQFPQLDNLNALLTTADRLMHADPRLDGAGRQRAHDTLRQIYQTAQLNTPVLLASPDVDGRFDVVEAGRIAGELKLIQKPDEPEGYVMLRLPLARHFGSSEYTQPEILYSLWSFFGKVANNQPHDLIMGEDAVVEWFRQQQLASLYTPEPLPYHVCQDFTLLQHMRQLQLPLSHLGLNEQQRGYLADFCAEYILDGIDAPTASTGSVCDILEYVTGATSQQEYNDLYGPFVYEAAHILPDGESDIGSGMTAMKVVELLSPRIRNHVGIPEGKADNSVLAAGALAFLYRNKAERLRGAVAEVPAYDMSPVTDWPPNHMLHSFRTQWPSTEQTQQDIDYLHHLGVQGAALDPAVWDHQRLAAVKHNLQAVFSPQRSAESSKAELAKTLKALEYVCTFGNDQQDFYTDVIMPYLIKNAPLAGFEGSKLRGLARLAAVVGDQMPEHIAPAGYAPGPSRTAALMADIYRSIFVVRSPKRFTTHATPSGTYL